MFSGPSPNLSGDFRLRQRRGGAATGALPLYNIPSDDTRQTGRFVTRKRRRRGQSSSLRCLVVVFSLVIFIVVAAILVVWTSPSSSQPSSTSPRDGLDQSVNKLQSVQHPKAVEDQEFGSVQALKSPTSTNDGGGASSIQMTKRPPSQSHETVICSDGKIGYLNDDYCDCPDGRDEPRTSACSNVLVNQATFLCTDGTSIYTSRVGDGVRDCPDGSDEQI